MVVGVVTRQRYWSVCFVCSVCLLMFSRLTLAWLCKHLILKITNRKTQQSEETEAKDNPLYLHCTGASWHVTMSVTWCHIMNIAPGSRLLQAAPHHRSPLPSSPLHTTLDPLIISWLLLMWSWAGPDLTPPDRITTLAWTSIEISKSLSRLTKRF